MSSLSKKVEVLVVGAGPTGLFTALELARAGIEVEIVDRAWRTAAQSYACGLYPATLELLHRSGVDGSLVKEGLQAEAIAFYEGAVRRAEVPMTQVSPAQPFLLVLPQYQLEEWLEDELRTRGVTVRWGHRLDTLRQDANAVTATVEQLALTSVGYPVARSEEMVDRAIEVRAQYLVGADGCHSHVRQQLHLPVEAVGKPSVFDVFEFEPVSCAAPELRIAMAAGTTDALWPQPGCMCRWSLEVGEGSVDHPEKDRHAIIVQDEQAGEDAKAALEKRLRARAPWFDAGVREVNWTTRVGFARMLAGDFGRDRCWLAGDAGHQTSPVGMQSMNVGLREAADLAGRLKRILRESASTSLLAEYGEERRQEWRGLLGTQGTVRAGASASAWVKAHRQRLLSCLPASGVELTAMASVLGLEWP